LELDRWKYHLPGPVLIPSQTTTERIEAVLTKRAESSGVTIVRGGGMTKTATQVDIGITVEVGENHSFRGRWLVRCYGGRSVIRKAARFKFVGTEPRYTAYSAKCDWEPPKKLTPGFHVTDSGMCIVARPNYLHLRDIDGAAFNRAQEITRERFQDAMSDGTGATDLPERPVLLAGDAAHINSFLEAQGMNLGLDDAINLCWKLAAIVRQGSGSDGTPADLALLDTNQNERHLIAAWVFGWMRAQVSTLQPDLYGAAVRLLIRKFIDPTDGTNLLVDRVWGLL
ncbi:MAG: hypothetical protein Q9214_005771, partial [Letrouitia sp. 1 TL-2023]